MHNKNQVLKKIGLTVFLLGAIAFLFPLAVHAIPMNDLNSVAANTNLPKWGTFGDIIKNIIQILLGVVAILAVAFIVISGYRFITSAGNEEAVSKAKANLTWAVAGLAVTLLAWVIMTVVLNTLKGP